MLSSVAASSWQSGLQRQKRDSLQEWGARLDSAAIDQVTGNVLYCSLALVQLLGKEAGDLLGDKENDQHGVRIDHQIDC